MPGRPSAPPPRRSLVRTSQRSRSEQEALIRAYELALPVVRQSVAGHSTPQDSPTGYQRRVGSQTGIGG